MTTEVNFINKIFKYKFSIIWSIVIFILCILPSDNLPKQWLNIPYFDKIIHFILFLILGIIYSFEKNRANKNNNIIVFILLGMILAFFTELSQKTFTTTRQFDFIDILADLTGTIVSYFISKKLKILKLAQYFGQF